MGKAGKKKGKVDANKLAPDSHTQNMYHHTTTTICRPWNLQSHYYKHRLKDLHSTNQHIRQVFLFKSSLQLILICLSVWLLRSKVHRKEFRRIARPELAFWVAKVKIVKKVRLSLCHGKHQSRHLINFVYVIKFMA